MAVECLGPWRTLLCRNCSLHRTTEMHAQTGGDAESLSTRDEWMSFGPWAWVPVCPAAGQLALCVQACLSTTMERSRIITHDSCTQRHSSNCSPPIPNTKQARATKCQHSLARQRGSSSLVLPLGGPATAAAPAAAAVTLAAAAAAVAPAAAGPAAASTPRGVRLLRAIPREVTKAAAGVASAPRHRRRRRRPCCCRSGRRLAGGSLATCARTCRTCSTRYRTSRRRSRNPCAVEMQIRRTLWRSHALLRADSAHPITVPSSCAEN